MQLRLSVPSVTCGCESRIVRKAECQRLDALELWCWRRLREPLGLQGDQPWILIGRTDAEAAAPIFWSLDVNSRLTGKVPDAGKDWRQKEKRVSENEMAGWHHPCNGHELGQTLGDGEGHGDWHAAVHGVTKSQTRLGNWTTTTTKWSKNVSSYTGNCIYIMTGNYVQYLIITYNGKEYVKEHIYTHTYIYTHIKLNPFAIHLKLTQHCKSTILQ